jgi:transposase, IS6 family
MSWNKTIVSSRSESPPAFGFDLWNWALNTIAGYESMHMIRKGQIRWLPKGDVVGQIRFIHQVYGIAA